MAGQQPMQGQYLANGNVWHAVPAINQFKVDPRKPFNGKILIGTALFFGYIKRTYALV